MKAKQTFQPERERVGLLGGTFNPIHNGHLKAAELVCRRLALEKVLFIPSYIPPHKENFEILPPSHRMRMVKLALESFSNFFPSEVEIEAPQTSYSIDTISKLKKIYPQAELFFILGIDAFLEIKTWKEYQKVLDQCSFVVISRPGYQLEDAWTALKDEYASRLMELPSGIEPPEIMRPPLIYLMELETLPISSTGIRKRIKANLSIEGLVPEPVAVYIQTNRLYQEIV